MSLKVKICIHKKLQYILEKLVEGSGLVLGQSFNIDIFYNIGFYLYQNEKILPFGEMVAAQRLPVLALCREIPIYKKRNQSLT